MRALIFSLRSLSIGLVALLLLRGAPASATLMRYDFSGTVTGAGSPYGATIDAFSAVSGHFYYDTDSAVSTTTSTTATYPQHMVGGFAATFGSVPVSADDYVIQVANNTPQPGGTFADLFTIKYSSALYSSPVPPFYLDGVSHTAGLFTLTLVGNSSLYSSMALPTQLNMSDFSSSTDLLNHASSGLIDVTYSVNTLTSIAVPEPATWGLFAMGAALWASRGDARDGHDWNDL